MWSSSTLVAASATARATPTFARVKTCDAASLDGAGVEEDRGDADKASVQRLGPARVGLDNVGSIRQTSGVWVAADDADLRAAGQRLGNQGPSHIAGRSGDQDHVNSLRWCVVAKDGSARRKVTAPTDRSPKDVARRGPVTMGGAHPRSSYV